MRTTLKYVEHTEFLLKDIIADATILYMTRVSSVERFYRTLMVL